MRVLSSDDAKLAITQIQQIVNGGLVEQISRLDQQGRRLSDPTVWDGPLAVKFRNEWPAWKATLDKATQELEQLREQLQQISTNIMTAGGGS